MLRRTGRRNGSFPMLVLVLVAGLCASTAQAAYTILALDTEVKEQFTGFNGSAAPSNWTVAGQSAWRGLNNGGSNTNGAYSWGSGTDGSLGFLASGSATTSATATTSFTNSTGGIITGLDISYDAELWRVGGRASDFTVAYSLDGTTWITLSSLYYTVANANGGSSGVAGTGAATNRSVNLTGLSIADDATFYLRWTYSGDGSGGSGARSGLGIDNLSLTAHGEVVITGGNYWDTNGVTAGVGGAGSWSTAGATWNTQEGTGSPVAFDPTKELMFAGTGGIINLTEEISHESGLRFDVTGYTLQGETLALNPSTTPTITVTTAGHVATINSVIAGFSGLAKAGAGTLVLGGVNTFAGDLTINGGILQVSSDDNLGASSNGIVLAGGTLKTTANVSLHEERATSTGGHAISGTGTLDVADGTTLTVNGTVSLTGVTFSNSGTVDLQGATNDLGAVTFSGNATVKGNDATAANITANHTGTATIQNNLNLGAVDRTITVSNAAAVLALQGTLTGSRIIKAGAGTLEATGDNAGLSLGFQLGSSAAAPTNGGTLKIGHKSGLGTTAQFRFNYGTLHAVTDLTGENALANSLSIGGRAGAAANFDGSNMEINGTVGFFRGTGTTGQLELNTMNTTTLSGDRAADSGTGAVTGITLGGTGKLILNGNWSTNTYAVTLAQSVTTEINNLFTGNVTVGDGNASGGTTPTLQGRGTLTGAVTINSDGRLKIGSTGDTTARVMTISGNLTSSGTMEFDLFSGSNGGEAGSSDKLAFGSGTTSVNLSGTLVINNADLNFGTQPWANGSFWQLIDWGTVQQANRTVNYSTITLPEIAGYEWINTLGTDGRITLSAVPEPGRMVLLLLGGGLMLIQRRRRRQERLAVV